MTQHIRYLLIKRQQKAKYGRTTQVIVAAFALIIVLGTLLLMLPAASRSGRSRGVLTAFFTATSATCVTGLALGDTYSLWSTFGQVVIICLIQVGGLGFVTIASIASMLLRRRIDLRQRLIIAQSYNVSGLEGMVRLVRHVVAATFGFELAGAVLLSVRFVPRFGWAGGIARGLFHSISAFCNAGFDILGILSPGSSLMLYASDPLVCLTVAALVIIGGLGFFVWEDILNYRKTKTLRLHTKLVLSISAILLAAGTVFFFFQEKEAAMKGMGFGQRLLASFFQSVTLRTAGYSTIDQSQLTDASKLFSIVLMLIGGSPGSTAGGVKTVSAGIMVLACAASLKGKKYVTAFGRTITQDQISSANSLFLIISTLAVAGAIFISCTTGIGVLDTLYETVSALATVGLSAGITGSLNAASTILIAVYMFFGRVGVMTIGIAFMLGKKDTGKTKFADGQVFIG